MKLNTLISATILCVITLELSAANSHWLPEFAVDTDIASTPWGIRVTYFGGSLLFLVYVKRRKIIRYTLAGMFSVLTLAPDLFQFLWQTIISVF